MRNKLESIYQTLPKVRAGTSLIKHIGDFLIIKREELVANSFAPICYLRVENVKKTFCVTLYGNTVSNGSSLVRKYKHVEMVLDDVLKKIIGEMR